MSQIKSIIVTKLKQIKMEKTAVEWLEDKIQSDMTFMEILGLIRQAKEMEKKQEIETWSSAYNDGFNNCKRKYKTK